VVAIRRIRSTREFRNGTANGHRVRWHTVTINRPPEEVAPDGRLPQPIAELGDQVEVEILNKQDAILKVTLSSVCGSDLHQISCWG
jgi:hypothetical protein